VADVFSEEEPSNIGLEEITFDETRGCWKITIGFSRPWDYQKSLGIRSINKGPTSSDEKPDREYKVVEVNDADGKIKAMKIRA